MSDDNAHFREYNTYRTSVLLWIQTVRHSESVPEIFFLKNIILKLSADDNKSKNTINDMLDIKEHGS